MTSFDRSSAALKDANPIVTLLRAASAAALAGVIASCSVASRPHNATWSYDVQVVTPSKVSQAAVEACLSASGARTLQRNSDGDHYAGRAVLPEGAARELDQCFGRVPGVVHDQLVALGYQ